MHLSSVHFKRFAIFPANFSFWYDNRRCIMEKVRPRNRSLLFFFIINASHCRSNHFAICRCFSREAESISSTSLIVGTLSAAFSGCIAVSWMIQYLKRHSLKVFAYYVWGLGILILTLQFTHVVLIIMIKKLMSLRSCFIHTYKTGFLFIKGKHV